jgi:hypothetical protein
MGQEINRIRFTEKDFMIFSERLRTETSLLGQWLKEGRFAQAPCVAGFELESWLIDHNTLPAPINEAYLNRLNHPLVTPELSRFNVELNGTPQTVGAGAFRALEEELNTTWRHCQTVAREMDAALLMIGILPTISEAELCLGNISPMNRYYALNEQVMRRRRGRPLNIRIDGREALSTTHFDVMLEAATTSFQIHLQVPERQAVRYFNASLIVSAPMAAACANSPFLFGRDLWDETRIPLFEQAVDSGSTPDSAAWGRVSFGLDYVQNSLLECFEDNLAQYPVLLPMLFETPPEQFSHLRLHNGTIWRWNRPLLGFDERGVPHFRVEHRVIPSGPSLIDQIANAAFYVGLVHFLANAPTVPEAGLPFTAAKDNFYTAARYGLEAELTWLGQTPARAQDLLLDELIPMAEQGLKMLGIGPAETEHYLGVIQSRVKTAQTGAAWQRGYIAVHGRDFPAMVAAYLENQRSGAPVHEWDI